LSVGANTIAMTTGTIGSNSTSVIDFEDFDVTADGLITVANDADGVALTVSPSVGTMTAIDVSDGNITNAISIGGNAIAGSNFDVTGAGAITGVSLDAGSGTIQTTGSVLGNAIDRTTSGALTIGNTTATSVEICNTSANCNTIKLGVGADADAITIGDTNDSFIVDSTAFRVTNLGAVSGITTLETSADWDWSAADSPTITIKADETFTISDAGGAFNFSVDTGPNYTGDAMPTKRITVSPEYPGASLTGDGGSNTGTMTSDSMTSTPFRNYYSWTTSEVSVQTYDIWVRVPLPADFSDMAATPTLSIDTYSSDLTNGTVLVTVYDTNNTADCTSAVFTPIGAINTWESKTQTTCLDTGTYAANGIVTIQIKAQAAASGGITRVSDIYFDYLAKF